MIRKLDVIFTESLDPYHNLAVEKYLMEIVKDGQCILYIWQNEKTVVIGRNQNARAECRLDILEQDGGHLARRLSGGGAVYHDFGNLNFTFIMPTGEFDTGKQTDVILRAVREAGIAAEKNGRNDLTVSGKKFSGHAYYHHGGKSYHHGTLMIDVNRNDMARYLNVPELKLKAKGVKSVRSRVCNLSESRGDLSVEEMKNRLVSAFANVYGFPAGIITEDMIDEGEIKAYSDQFASSEWKYGKNQSTMFTKEKRFEWGLVRVDYSVENNIITSAFLWTDGLRADFLSEVPERIKGTALDKQLLFKAMADGNAGDREIVQLSENIADMIAGEADI